MFRSLVLLSFLFAVICAQAFDCTNQNDGNYCNADGNYTSCASGVSTVVYCAMYDQCQCGTGVLCDEPCKTTCEQGPQSYAQIFCYDRIDEFSGDDEYYCSSSQNAYYHCIRDPYCPHRSSPRSSIIYCDDSSICACKDQGTHAECFSGALLSPCIPIDPPAPTDCNGQGWTDGGSNSVTLCNEEDGYCLVDADGSAVCAQDFICNTAEPCVEDSDCEDGQVCIVNSSCGSDGLCTASFDDDDS